MPLRPSLIARFPLGPKPKKLRRIHCPSCAHVFKLSSQAMSARCPRCSRGIKLDDLTIKQTVKGRVLTMGQIHIEADSHMKGRIACGTFVNEGRFHGEMTATGPVDLRQGSLTSGRLLARSLHIRRGARCRLKLAIVPPDSGGKTHYLDSGEAVLFQQLVRV